MAGNVRWAWCCLLGTSLSLAWPPGFAQGGGPGAKAAQGRAEYQEWVDDWLAEGSIMPVLGDGGKVVVGAETEDGRDCCIVSADGSIKCRRFGGLSRMGGGAGKLPVANLKRLGELLAKIPDDGSRLPPFGRRVMIQAAAGKQRLIVRVYDRANAPDLVLEVLRLSRCGVRAWVPELKPQNDIEAYPSSVGGGFLCLSHDCKRVIFTSLNGPLRFFDLATRKLIGEASVDTVPPEAVALSPDGTFAAVTGSGRQCAVVETKTWKELRTLGRYYAGLVAPRFTPDGKYLVLENGRSGAPLSLQIFDTRTWNRADRLPGVPEDAGQYVPAADGKHAVVRSGSGIISLWDLQRRSAVARLDKGSYVCQAAFSPDGSLLAIATTTWLAGHELGYGYPRLRVWKVGTGELLREFLPFEQDYCEELRGLNWSPDGQYLLAATLAESFFSNQGISVWNVKTGRHRGEFTGCPCRINGVVLLPDGSKLVAGCEDGHVRFWDFPAGMKRIREFEDSLKSL
jgi:WD40 repeat protein